MKAFTFIFIRGPRKIFRIISHSSESCYYRFFYSKRKIETDLTQKRYLICGGGSPGDIANAYRELFPEKVKTKISEADLICEHIFELLGSGPKRLSQEGNGYQPIDWHSDFKSSYKWNPKTFYRDIRYRNQEGADIKVPWELSRFQHLNTLGQAYILTGEKKYAKEFENQIIDWIRNNPVCFGVNWKSTMDVAIRAANWLVAMEYFAKVGLFTQDFLNEFYESIYEHGRFIRSHLEYSRKLNSNHCNHYITNIAGLLFISICCPFFKESIQWKEFAIRELSEEIEKQVYPDGCNFEASTSYHRLVLEILFYCQLLCQRVGLRIPTEYRAKLRKMFEFSLYCIKPNGKIPQIGDNDNGRFLIFAKRPILEHKYLLTLAAIYYKDSSFKLPQFNFDEEAFWIFGKGGKKSYDELQPRIEPLASKSFPDAGWFIIRHNHDYCFISCGPNGQNGNGGHSHNDKLSFELVLNGQDIIVDPGTYVYTPYPDERNKFRSTEYHNTIKFDEYEQNEIPQDNVFRLIDRVRIKNAILRDTKYKTRFEGEVEYAGITHKRIISLDKKSCNWQIEDDIFCSKQIDGRLTFHLSPDLVSDHQDIFIKETKKKVASVELKGSSFEKGIYNYSPEYGLKVKAEQLIAEFTVKKKSTVIITYIKKIRKA